MDSYRYEINYRCPIYEDWIYFTLTPKLEWDDDKDWKTVPLVMFGLDLLFDGLSSTYNHSQVKKL